MRVTEEQMQGLVGDLLRGGQATLVAGEEYARRLAACGACESLDYGTTCRHCGCLVPVIAWLAEKHCTHPTGPRW